MDAAQGSRTLLIADRDAQVAEPLVRYFRLAGYDVDWVRSGRDLLAVLASNEHVDVVLAELDLPGLGGRDVCAAVRGCGFDGVLVVTTAHDDELTVVSAFASGADDVVTKPLRIAETRARVDRLCRRLDEAADAHRFHGLSLDLRARRVAHAGAEIPLGHKELEALALMMHSPGSVVPRAELLDRLWRDETPTDKAVDALIARLRHKLGAAGVPVVISAVRGVGWRLDTLST